MFPEKTPPQYLSDLKELTSEELSGEDKEVLTTEIAVLKNKVRLHVEA